MNGEYVKRNLHNTKELLLKASNIDNYYTQYRLSKLYLDNNGDLFNSDKGLDYFSNQHQMVTNMLCISLVNILQWQIC